ncbi:MAG: hypothetical protein LUG89_00380 [Methanosphaera sp.]|nr:hypothetical protein [Methanosphaera sp.]
MNNKGQIVVEYILLVFVILVVLISITNMILSQTEENTIITAAHTGIQNGVDKNGYAMYYNDTYNKYQESYQALLMPTTIDIVKIDSYIDGKNMEIQVTLHTSRSLTSQEKYILGSRINYYLRKSITDTFNKTNESNTYYDPAYSNNYIITTRNVRWI